MAQALKNRRVAILATDGFEQVELTEPKQALEQAGAQVHVVAPQGDSIQGWNHYEKGDQVPVDRLLDQVNPSDYDALVLPGGVINPDQLRTNQQAVQFIKAFFRASKPVAAICHGPWTLVEADVVRGRTVTSWPSLKTDLSNAGANWVDQEVVVDQGLVTSRNPNDLPAFNSKIVEEFCEGKHLAQAQSA
ncbi:type 1 glutamine amidotransferase domain-containing protein [Nodosilinea sp. PGN35]|uniref:type 1 glutamine amidotransferase domain-containing protein n=1 Tax=Nodosilinea sp. PGN35 TaxID=3020489 RepID=UPI0023B31770|nr:type 1 glutamine amidotransferase domain-containing protein [Nodosilinea sp. TSF1-S3]MDF0369502.1 type 1 glutamine amidotransferase [Nodosilinea sp. TSF1-S3]